MMDEIMNLINDTIINKLCIIDETNEDKTKKIIEEQVMDNPVIKSRMFECVLCNSKAHSITKCVLYKNLKANLEKRNYVKYRTNKLNDNDELGFCASGIIPYVLYENKVYLLVLVEKRNNQLGLNFIGGKRECVKCVKEEIITRPETSYETAVNEFNEELGEILDSYSLNIMSTHLAKCKTPKFVFWFGDSKMCLYGIKFPSYILTQLVLNTEDKTKTEAQGFEWIVLDDGEYKENNEQIKMHGYSKSILRAMKKISKNLNNLFIN